MLTTKLRECLGSALTAEIRYYEEEVAKLFAKQEIPGWNYCQFFVVKEALAFVYERASLLEDALKQYDDLAIMFRENTTRAGTNSMLRLHMETFGTTAGDDSLPLLDTTSKNYRDMIHQNSITEFDFRKYLFARQAHVRFFFRNFFFFFFL